MSDRPRARRTTTTPAYLYLYASVPTSPHSRTDDILSPDLPTEGRERERERNNSFFSLHSQYARCDPARHTLLKQTAGNDTPPPKHPAPTYPIQSYISNKDPETSPSCLLTEAFPGSWNRSRLLLLLLFIRRRSMGFTEVHFGFFFDGGVCIWHLTCITCVYLHYLHKGAKQHGQGEHSMLWLLVWEWVWAWTRVWAWT